MTRRSRKGNCSKHKPGCFLTLKAGVHTRLQARRRGPGAWARRCSGDPEPSPECPCSLAPLADCTSQGPVSLSRSCCGPIAVPWPLGHTRARSSQGGRICRLPLMSRARKRDLPLLSLPSSRRRTRTSQTPFQIPLGDSDFMVAHDFPALQLHNSFPTAFLLSPTIPDPCPVPRPSQVSPPRPARSPSPVEGRVDPLLSGEAQHPADHAAVVGAPAFVTHFGPAVRKPDFNQALSHR